MLRSDVVFWLMLHSAVISLAENGTPMSTLRFCVQENGKLGGPHRQMQAESEKETNRRGCRSRKRVGCCWFVALRCVMLRSEFPCRPDEPEQESASTGHKFYESGPVRFPRNTTKMDVALVALQQEGGFSTEQMRKIIRSSCSVLCSSCSNTQVGCGFSWKSWKGQTTKPDSRHGKTR